MLKMCRLLIVFIAAASMAWQCSGAVTSAKKTLVGSIINQNKPANRIVALIRGSSLSVDQLMNLYDDPAVGEMIKTKVESDKAKFKKALEAATAAGGGGMTPEALKEALEKAGVEPGFSDVLSKNQDNLVVPLKYLFGERGSGTAAVQAAVKDQAKAKLAVEAINKAITEAASK